MKNKIYISIISLFLSSYSYCQDLSYQIIENDGLEDMNDVAVTITPLLFNGSMDDYATGSIGLGGYYRIGSKFIFNCNYNFAYLDRISERFLDDNDGLGTGTPEKGSSPQQEWNIGGTYFFAKKIKEKKNRFTLNSETIGNSTVNTVTFVPIKKHYLYGVNFNVGRFMGQYNYQSSDEGKAINKTSNSNEIVIIPSDYLAAGLFSRKKFMYFKAGFSILRVTNAKVKFNLDYGERTDRRVNKFNLNLIVGFASKIEDMRIATEKTIPSSALSEYEKIVVFDIYNLDDNTPFNPIGFEVGFETIGLGEKKNLTFNMKGGVRPGYHDFAYNFFGEFGVVITLSRKMDSLIK